MKFAIVILTLLIVVTIGVQFIVADTGYVLINFRGYIIEMSVPGLALIVLAIVIAIWIVRAVFRAPRKLGEAASSYRGQRAGKRFTQGLIEIAEGNYSKGERLLTRGATHADAPLLNYLAAARAAQLQNQDSRRDNWLKLAYEKQPEASSAILLTQAELQIAHEQYELAQATLKQLDEQEQGKGQAAVLLGKLYHQLNDWRALGELLPRLTRIGKPPKATLDEWSVDVYTHRLTETGDFNGDVPRVWSDVPKALKSHTALQVAYIDALLATGNANQAESEARRMLKHRWDAPLVLRYGLIQSDDTGQQLKNAENWLGKHPEDAALLLTAGRLCMASKLWGKARSYLESSLAITPGPAAYASYGELLSQLGESGSAADAFQKGLLMAAENTLALPKPSE